MCALKDAVASRRRDKIWQALGRVTEGENSAAVLTAQQGLRELGAMEPHKDFWSPCSSQGSPPAVPSWIPPSPARQQLPVRSTMPTVAGLHIDPPLAHVFCPCGRELGRV